MSCPSPSAEASLKRHCAFCLKEICGEEIKKCGKCRKRAYCSKECQTADWTPNEKNGQGHKNWCGTDCGEEDIDWMVTSIPGKGLGLVALRDIPAAYPIIVEPVVDKTHPGVADLMPINGSLDDKFNFNSFECGVNNSGEASGVCLRTSRTNHSCDPNAETFYEKYTKANILFAGRDIKKGQEICISYVGFTDLKRTDTPEMSRDRLRRKWGIFCDESCLCFDQAFFEKVKQGREFDKVVMRLRSAHSAGNATEVVAAIKERLELEKGLNLSVINVKRTIDNKFQITIEDMNAFRLRHRPENDNAEHVKFYEGRPCSMYMFRVIHERP